MRYREDDVVSELVEWVRGGADMEDLAAFWSEFRPGEIVSVVRGDDDETGTYLNGKRYYEHAAKESE